VLKLYIRSVLFVIPVLISLTLLPIDKRSKCRELINDCIDQCLWIYDRIVSNQKAIDIVFIGSSHTLNSINDELITNHLKNTICTNIGYCRLGTDLHYVFTKDVIHYKKPKHIVLEIRESEDRYSHPLFPYLAENSDVLLPSIFFNEKIVSNIWIHYLYNVEIFQDKIYNIASKSYYWKIDFGFDAHYDTIPHDEIIRLPITPNCTQIKELSMEEKFHLQFSRSYVKKIYQLCKNNNMKLHFLYLPSYGNKPSDYYEYLKYGEIIIPPQSIFQNTNNWHDSEHLNISGATAFSIWMSEYIYENWK
jgi:hypothetical protein